MKTTIIRLMLAAATLISMQIMPQSVTAQIHGLVTDTTTKSPLPGTTVIIKHTQNGVCTNPQGKYTIQAVPGDTLVFAFIGFNSQEIIVKNKEHNVALQPDAMTLEEVTVTGYMSVKKASLVGSCTSFTSRNTRQKEYKSSRDASQEEYKSLRPNSFQTALSEPLSTFSIDVDAASYANMRRFINSGQLPPSDAIRSEELINYFNYDYPAPTGQEPVNIITEISACPWNTGHRLVHIGLKAKNINPAELPASNLVFLIDVSGSMDMPNKLPLLQASLKLLTTQLRPTDRVAIVTYAGNTAIALPSTSGDKKNLINRAIEQLQAAGSTAGEAGIRKAYEIAREHFITGGNNRIILATDGDFNVGISSEKELETLIEKERNSGVFLTVLGYGMGNYKDNKLQTLAQKGNGNHAYIDNLSEARKVLVKEFGASMYTIAKDVKLQIEFNPSKVEAYRLIGYESRLMEAEEFNDDTKDAGEMGIGHTVTALYEIIPAGQTNPWVDPLKYQQKAKSTQLTDSPELMTIKLRYKAPEKNKSQKIEIAIADKPIPLARTSDAFRFSAAVAGFGMLLTQSPYSNNYTYSQIATLARQALGNDPEGYRREFIRLVEATELLKQQN